MDFTRQLVAGKMDAPEFAAAPDRVAARSGVRAPAVLRPSAIVTAYNPASRMRSTERNRRVDAALLARIHALANRLAAGLKGSGVSVPGSSRFDTATTASVMRDACRSRNFTAGGS